MKKIILGFLGMAVLVIIMRIAKEICRFGN